VVAVEVVVEVVDRVMVMVASAWGGGGGDGVGVGVAKHAAWHPARVNLVIGLRGGEAEGVPQ
jgi:hypothetical protein